MGDRHAILVAGQKHQYTIIARLFAGIWTLFYAHQTFNLTFSSSKVILEIIFVKIRGWFRTDDIFAKVSWRTVKWKINFQTNFPFFFRHWIQCRRPGASRQANLNRTSDIKYLSNSRLVETKFSEALHVATVAQTKRKSASPSDSRKFYKSLLVPPSLAWLNGQYYDLDLTWFGATIKSCIFSIMSSFESLGKGRHWEVILLMKWKYFNYLCIALLQYAMGWTALCTSWVTSVCWLMTVMMVCL